MTPSEEMELDDAWTKEFYPAKCAVFHDQVEMELNAVSHGCERWRCASCDTFYVRWKPEPGHEAPRLIRGCVIDRHVETVPRPRKVVVVGWPVGDIRVTADPTLKPGEFEFSPPTAPVGTIRQLGGGVYEVMTKDGWRPHVGVDLGFGPTDYAPSAPPGADRVVFDNPNSVTISGPTFHDYRKTAPTYRQYLDAMERLAARPLPAHAAAPITAMVAACTSRPDGFDQGRIDAIKADMLAVGRKR